MAMADRVQGCWTRWTPIPELLAMVDQLVDQKAINQEEVDYYLERISKLRHKEEIWPST